MRNASAAKITQPDVRGVIPRKRLFRVLDKRPNGPLLWVTGPPGSGKTSLIASYISARKIPTLWYQVDEGDADLATFFYYMGMAAKKAAPKKRNPLPLLTPEYLMGIPVFTRRFFEDLCGRVKAPFFIILDNYQDVSSDSGFHAMISHGLEAVPEGVKVIALSRSGPPPELSRLRANGGVDLLNWNDLRFSVEEFGELVKGKRMTKPDKAMLKDLYEKTEGWVAGLILLLEQAVEDPARSGGGRLAELSNEGIFDYLANEIFLKTDKATREFLLKTSFFPAITLTMAEALTGDKGSGKILAELSRKHFFTERLSSAEPTYRYHPLFRSFLLAHAGDFLPDGVHEIRKKAAGLLEGAGFVEDAAGLLIAAGDWAELARLICARAPALMAQGRGAILHEWISALPPDIIEQSPWVLFWMGTCRAVFNPVEGRTYFEKAFPLFERVDDPVGLFLTWAGIVETYIFEWADFKPLDHWIAALEKILARHARFPSVEIEARVTGSMFHALVYRQPHHPECTAWKDRLISLLASAADDRQRIMLVSSLLTYYFWIGDFPQARLLLDSFRLERRSRDFDPMPLLFLRVLEATYLWCSGEFAKCLQSVNGSLSIAESSGVHFLDFGILAQGLYSSLTNGDAASRADFLRRMKPLMTPARLLDVAHYHYLAGWEALRRNDIPHALAHERRAVAHSEDSGSPFPEAICNIGLAHVLITMGEHQEALPHIARARSIGREMKSTYLGFTVQIAEAQLAQDQADDEKCLELLSQAFSIGNKEGFFYFAMWVPEVMVRLCVKALEAAIEVDYVHELIRKSNLHAGVPHDESEHWPWPLKIFTLGKFEIIRDGKKLEFKGKVQQKPLAMLKLLVALGGREVVAEQIIDALWPEAEGDTAHISFKTTLHRLRQLVGSEQAVRLQEGRITLDERSCWIDAVAFQALVEKSENGGYRDSSGTKRDPQALRRRAINLYTGDFLPGDAKEPWAIRMRERLKMKAIRLFDADGRFHEEEGAWEKALECYERALEINELHEDFYERLMGCYMKQGKKAEALAVYHRCKKVLSAVLGIEPSARTEDIYKKIKTAL
ncbi:MAG: hypothetical protein HZA17_13335 [Nitrospirae bacterium]|nr:hypothetical protein [Nitrospirota bacterium]